MTVKSKALLPVFPLFAFLLPAPAPPCSGG